LTYLHYSFKGQKYLILLRSISSHGKSAWLSKHVQFYVGNTCWQIDQAISNNLFEDSCTHAINQTIEKGMQYGHRPSRTMRSLVSISEEGLWRNNTAVLEPQFLVKRMLGFLLKTGLCFDHFG